MGGITVELADVSNLKCDINICIKGDENRICLGIGDNSKSRNFEIDSVGRISIEGKNNFVELADITNLNCDIQLAGKNNKTFIGKFSQKATISVAAMGYQNNREVRIEGGRTILGCHLWLYGNDKKIIIGKNCMFSDKITIRTTDSHFIYDLETHEHINEDKDIMIGEHVWIGRDVFVAKGSIIPSGCVIGAKSFVNKAFTKENCIIAGVPAKVVKENIHWEA